MPKLDPNIIRVGDKVKIVNPEFFDRCGYPMSLKSAIDEVSNKFKPQIMKLLSAMFKESLSEKHYDREMLEKDLDMLMAYNPYNRHFEEIAKAAGSVWIKSNGYGGDERRIYTKICEDYRGKIAIVDSIRMVKTGDYVPASGGNDYWGESDYEPAYLTNQKSHKILSIFYPRLISTGEYNEIEEIHVEKIQKEEKCLSHTSN